MSIPKTNFRRVRVGEPVYSMHGIFRLDNVADKNYDEAQKSALTEVHWALKMKITVEFTREDGTKETKPIEVDTTVPDFEEFEGPHNFREVFHKYEQAVLKIRDAVAEIASEEYLSELSKKKSRQGSKGKKE